MNNSAIFAISVTSAMRVLYLSFEKLGDISDSDIWQFLRWGLCISHLDMSAVFAISAISAIGVFCISHLDKSSVFAISAISAMGALYLSFA